MSRLLKNNHIQTDLIARHAHLTSPLHLTPLTNPQRITIIGGKHDRIYPSRHLKSLCSHWKTARYLEVNQGYFGYAAMRCALAIADGYLASPS
jgi:hypothetical protein